MTSYRKSARLSMAKQKNTPTTPTRKRATASPRVEPRFVPLMAPTSVDGLPPRNIEWDPQNWVLEPKLDGWRALILVRRGAVQILSRNNKDLTLSYPGIAASALCVHADSASIDGEIVGLDSRGRVSFQALQGRRGPARYYGFDLLTRNGVDIMSRPIEERRAQLAKVIEGTGLGLTVELPGPPADALALAREYGFSEGLLAKRLGSPYRPPRHPTERSSDWLKWKTLQGQEFVVGGFRPDGPLVHELVVGYYDDEQALQFAARVKDGLVAYERRKLFRFLQPLVVTECPFVDLPTSERESSQWGGGVSAKDMRQMRWVRPSLVVQIGFVEWTNAGRLRHSVYTRIREDKSAEDVRRE